MIYTVESNQKINYNPKNSIEDVVRNVHMILRTMKEEQPLMRDFALDNEFIDKNINVVRNKMISLLLDILKKYEPRAILKNIDFIMLEDNEFNVVLEIEVII